ncbi:MAG: glycosyltransferase family A protein [bacterium]
MSNSIVDAKTISIILPTRKRVRNLTRLIDSIIQTSKYPSNIEICIRVDHDDMESALALIPYSDKITIKVCIGSREKCYGHYWNDAWRLATGDVLQMSGDDFIYRTKDWDVEILKEINKFNDKMVFVYGNDGFQHGNLGTHFFIHRRWADALGEFVQMHTNVFYHDTWADVLATRINRRMYRDDLFFEHVHWVTGKTGKDVIYETAQKNAESDARIWEANWQGPAMQSDVAKLKRLLNE